MPLFRLSPVDLSDPNWEASSHRAAAIVRARDESAARTIEDRLPAPAWPRGAAVAKA